ncbi:SDR family NAD(P)-dependent oxidoreductase [uncultured Paraglaciecola sp.]|uniref:SDR family NAD(P)-dependent oxidoreductase n=1 Tax=uncultured Paraglaciecola sp. TaxID=1765024 RepID=UPI0030DD5800|tara:strand:+ start:424480 stop:424923 length:444 start_codon:yes stop_codon:yes gene_type:complete
MSPPQLKGGVLGWRNFLRKDKQKTKVHPEWHLPGMIVYGATKRAVTYLNKSLQKEIKGTQVQVNTLSLGIVVTDLLIGDYDTSSPEWHKVKKIFNILGDKVETVTPWLVNGILATKKTATTVAWLTGGKAFWRFMSAAFNKRDLFAE